MEGVGMARHLVDAVGIGRHAREAVAHDDSSDRSAVGVRHYAVEIVPLLDRGVQRGRVSSSEQPAKSVPAANNKEYMIRFIV